MTTGADIAAVAALVGDPARANILSELLGGRALAAGELARIAGVAPSTASEHLAKLTEAGLLERVAQGRARYYRLASPEVAAMLESIITVAADPDPRPRAAPRVPSTLKHARTCYDHIAGELGVAIADALIARGAVVLHADGGELTEAGAALLQRLGAGSADGRSKRPFCRACLDWSERRPHISGTLGAQLLQRSLDLRWINRAPEGRGLTVTPAGRAGYRELLGIEA
ncbi:MAG TPA: winged helix-turn-helix domain-containing protein [Caulobacteraceae bacterium]|jgi:DNA-binding transcriptional ArsR family regulator